MSLRRDDFHVIAFMSALNSPVASSLGSKGLKICDKNLFNDTLRIILRI